MPTYIKRLERIDVLIKNRSTGTPTQLAKRLGVNKSTIYNYIKVMKRFNAPITYSKERESYIYTTNGSFSIGFAEEL